MAEFSKLTMSDYAENHEMSYQKISVVSDKDQSRAHFSGENQSSSGSSFVVDIESFPARSSDKDLKTSTSRIIRSYSKKGCAKMTNLNHALTESPRGSKTPKAFVSVENHVGSDHHHHVTITATDPEPRPNPRRLTLSSSIRRTQSTFIRKLICHLSLKTH